MGIGGARLGGALQATHGCHGCAGLQCEIRILYPEGHVQWKISIGAQEAQTDLLQPTAIWALVPIDQRDIYFATDVT